MTFSYPTYLQAKRTVDARARNQTVWQACAAALQAQAVQAVAPLHALELGCGTGSQLPLLATLGLPMYYRAVDAHPDNIAAAQTNLSAAALAPLSVTWQCADIHSVLAQPPPAGGYQILLAQAVLDLFHLPSLLPKLAAQQSCGGLLYASINFDGLTCFEPLLDPTLDALILACYHRTMDERLTAGQLSGDSQAGRHLFRLLPTYGYDILAIGASDWVVHPIRGRYPAQEADFLHAIITTVDLALRQHPELPATRLADWVAARHAQIERAELLYVAHQLDYLAERNAATIAPL